MIFICNSLIYKKLGKPSFKPKIFWEKFIPWAGWTGMWMDGLARSPYMIDYTLPNMGIDMSNNQEDAFVHGLTFGIDINR